MAKVIEGLDELAKSLQELKKNAATNALRFAARKAGKIVLDEARANAPVGSQYHTTYLKRKVAPGFLARNLVSRAKLQFRKGSIRVDIGPRAEAFYGTQFLELGVPSRGIPKRPWLVPALLAKEQEVIDTFVTELRAAIARSIKRGAVRR